MPVKRLVETHVVPWETPEEQVFTERMVRRIEADLEEALDLFDYGEILVLLLRLRQASIDPQIVLNIERRQLLERLEGSMREHDAEA